LFDYHAGWALIHKGQGEAARERFRRRAQNTPARQPDSAVDIGLSYLREGRHREAEAEFIRALGILRTNNRISDEIQCRFNLGEALLIQGRFTEALAQFGQAEKISDGVYKFDFNPVPLARRLYAGRVFVSERQFDKAAAAAAEIKGIVNKQNMAPAYLDFYYLLEAEIATAQNKPEEALRVLDRASFHAWWSSPFYWRTRAAAEEALGRFKPAVESYKKFVGFVIIARLDIGDQVRYFYELSMADYNLGRIAEKTGDPAAAKDHYRKFLEGMAAADPGLPEVGDAQKRLAALK
jgi:tetratricopeptide (TPR) repeat protein